VYELCWLLIIEWQFANSNGGSWSGAAFIAVVGVAWPFESLALFLNYVAISALSSLRLRVGTGGPSIRILIIANTEALVASNTLKHVDPDCSFLLAKVARLEFDGAASWSAWQRKVNVFHPVVSLLPATFPAPHFRLARYDLLEEILKTSIFLVAWNFKQPPALVGRNANDLTWELSFVECTAVDFLFRVHDIVLIKVDHLCASRNVPDLTCTHLLEVMLLIWLATSSSYATCFESLIDANDTLRSHILTGLVSPNPVSLPLMIVDKVVLMIKLLVIILATLGVLHDKVSQE